MATRLSYMDKAGVQLQILSPSPMTPCAADAKVAAEAAKLINDMLADLTVRHPDRFRFVAALPLPHVEEALAEMDRSAKLDNFVGFAMTTSTSGKVLTDPAFLPIWEELDERSACLVLHPAGVNACSPLLSDSLIWPVGSPIEDSVAVVQLITNGYPSRFPNVTIVNAHFGGILPMVVDRFNHQLPHAVANLPESPVPQLRACTTTPSGRDPPPRWKPRSPHSAPNACCSGPTFRTKRRGLRLSDRLRAFRRNPGRRQEGCLGRNSSQALQSVISQRAVAEPDPALPDWRGQ